MLWAEKGRNQGKALEFKERLVECVVYTAQELVRRRRLSEAEEVMAEGREYAKRYGIEELEFHLSLLEREVEAVRRRRREAAQAS